MDQNYTAQQYQSAFKLCDLLGLQDITIAISILQDVDWSIEKAFQVMQDPKIETKKQQNVRVPENYHNQEEESEKDTVNDQYDYNIDEKNEQQNLDEMFQGNKLDRTTSEPPTKMEKRLSYDRHILQNYSKNRHSYQAHLLQDAQKLYEKLLDDKKLDSAERSKIKNDKNRQFICELQKKYKSKINFTFGTFFLNLLRSYLDKKFLLVYIHKRQVENSQSVKMLLTHPEISKFINKNCVIYGMFDNSDDFEILQKYVRMKDLPAFAVFKYSKKTQKQKFLSSYSILQKQPECFIQWLANTIGVQIKKKEVYKPKNEVKEINKKTEGQPFSHSQIMDFQNHQYEEMERIYHLKRQQSKIKKQQITHLQQLIQKRKQQFNNQAPVTSEKAIQIKFRLPNSGKPINHIFSTEDQIKKLFDFVDCFGRDQFQQKYANFDLTQTFPRLSLKDKKDKKIKEVFEDSTHQNLIVKQQ